MALRPCSGLFYGIQYNGLHICVPHPSSYVQATSPQYDGIYLIIHIKDLNIAH